MCAYTDDMPSLTKRECQSMPLYGLGRNATLDAHDCGLLKWSVFHCLQKLLASSDSRTCAATEGCS